MDKKIKSLISVVERLPGLGPKSARRMVLHLLKSKEGAMLKMIDAMQLLYDEIVKCTICGNLESESPCSICTNHKRNSEVMCIVEEITDLWAIEKAGFYNGIYHVLNGALSVINGITPEMLRIDQLGARINELTIKEVIIATNSTVEGQTTAQYIFSVIKSSEIKISFLATGIPIGGEMDYLDEGTLSVAFANRRSME